MVNIFGLVSVQLLQSKSEEADRKEIIKPAVFKTFVLSSLVSAYRLEELGSRYDRQFIMDSSSENSLGPPVNSASAADSAQFLSFFAEQLTNLWKFYSSPDFQIEERPSFESMSEFEETLHSWVITGQVTPVLELACKCVWRSRASQQALPGVSMLFSLLRGNAATDYLLLKLFFYFYKYDRSDKNDLEKKGLLPIPEGLAATLVRLIPPLHEEFEASIARHPFALDGNEARTYRLSCYLLMRALLPSPEERDIGVVTLKLFEEVCSDASLPVETVTSAMCYSSVMLKRRKKESTPLETKLTHIFFSPSTELFELIIDTLASVRTVPKELLEEMLVVLIEKRLEVHDGPLASFIAQHHLLAGFVKIFHTCDLPTFHKGIKQCGMILSRIRAGSYSMTLPEAIEHITNNMTVVSVDNDICSECQEFQERLYKLQFREGYVSDTFSEAYLLQLVKNKDLTKVEMVKYMVEDWLLYAVQSNSGLSTSICAKFARALLSKCLYEKYVIAANVFDLIENSVIAIPALRSPIALEARNVLKDTTAAMEELERTNPSLCNQTRKSATMMTWFIQNVEIISTQSCSFPTKLRKLVRKYTAYILAHVTDPDEEKRTKIIDKCTKDCSIFTLGQVILEFIHVRKYTKAAVFYSMVANLEKLRSKEEEFRKKPPTEEKKAYFNAKWRGHASLLTMLFNTPDPLALAFRTSGDIMLQSFVLTSITQSFYKKRKYVTHEKVNSMFARTLQGIIQVQFSGFTPPAPGRVQVLIRRVLRSAPFLKAFAKLTLPTDHLSELENKYYFAPLAEGNQGVSVPLGGFIVLNAQLQRSSPLTDCILMIRVAHEAAHMTRRLELAHGTTIQGVESSPAVDLLNKSPKGPIKQGLPGDSQIQIIPKAREGGALLEEELFGAFVEKLSSSQMEFLCDEVSWSKDLDTFKAELEARGKQAAESEIHHLPRAQGDIRSLNRSLQCMVHGLAESDF